MYVVIALQDWWDEVKNQLEKQNMDKKIMRELYGEMSASLCDSKTQRFGPFRKKFVQVHTNTYCFHISVDEYLWGKFFLFCVCFFALKEIFQRSGEAFRPRWLKAIWEA